MKKKLLWLTLMVFVATFLVGCGWPSTDECCNPKDKSVAEKCTIDQMEKCKKR